MRDEGIAGIDDLIVAVHGQRVILAADLARIYGVETRALNQAVKRILEKFPADFMFQLTLEEAEAVQRSRSQIVILKRGTNIKPVLCPHGAWGHHGGERPQQPARRPSECLRRASLRHGGRRF